MNIDKALDVLRRIEEIGQLADARVYMFSPHWKDDNWDVGVEFKCDGMEFKLKAGEQTLMETIEAVLVKYDRITKAMPECNPNRTLEHMV